MLTLLQSIRKHAIVQQVASFDICADDMAIKCKLHRYLTPIVLPKESSDDGSFLLSQGVSCDVVRDGEEDQRVEDDLEIGTLLGREQRIGVRTLHDFPLLMPFSTSSFGQGGFLKDSKVSRHR